ncbi:unnamed protein product [Rotaria magnacalcarata]|uniref:Uncharacterized protein n=2 Tax=Rotaria magnacalcarata TaxID=392030 RepID=A0A8S2QZN2_9BILA|nr:unnamed protein product [Rotaria magnacalcarata]
MWNVIFVFDDDAIHEMMVWGNICKQKSFNTRNTDECLSARLGKAIQHAYRMVTFLQTIEIEFIIHQNYLNAHHQFPSADQFVSVDCQPFRLKKDVALRAIDLISCSMCQYAMLFDATNACKVSSIGRKIIVAVPDQQQCLTNSSSSTQHNELKQNKQRQRYVLNFNNVTTAVILFPTICFTTKQRHRLTLIHNNSSGGLLKHQHSTEIPESFDEETIPIAFTNIFDRESVIEKHTHGKASITATHIIHQLDESSSGISSQNREDSMNNGFLRSIAWKTQSHSKESKDLNLSSTSLTRRTRAHLKCRNKNKDRPRKPKNDS